MTIPYIQAAWVVAIWWTSWRLMRRLTENTALDNVPGPPSHSFFGGHLQQMFDPNGWEFHKSIAEKYGGILRTKAILGKNVLFIFDPKAMHRILLKEHHIYEETSRFIDSNLLFFGPGLLGTLGDRHRRQRKMLNPVFSISHMRHMTPVFWEIIHKVQITLGSKVKDGPQEIDMSHWITRTALELMGQSGFGYSFDPLTKDGVPHPFCGAVKELLPVSNTPGLVFASFYGLSIGMKLGSARFRRWVVDMASQLWPNLRRLRDIVDLMHTTSLEILDTKKQALKEGDEVVSKQIAKGKDILSILLRANMAATAEDRLPEEELIAQISTLTFAAMDTTSAALSRILDQLAMHPDVQDKLRVETLEAIKQHGGFDMSYDDLMALPFLDAVCRETLRLFPPISHMARTTRQDTILPLSSAIKGIDGREIHEIAVPNNTSILISIISANRNPEIWGLDSYEWKPERWLQPLPSSVVDAHIPGIYSHLMTFLGGGRSCIGFKFSELEMKVVLTGLLSKFKFAPSKEKKINWQMGPIATPAVIGEDPLKPMLPMLVTLLA